MLHLYRRSACRQSNPDILSDGACPGGPRREAEGAGATATYLLRLVAGKAAVTQSRCKSCPRGPDPSGSFNLAGVGSSRPGNRRDRVADRTRRSGEKTRRRIAQPRKARQQGLASESGRRRRRIAKNLHRWIRGCFCVRSPEIAHVAETMPRREPGTYGARPEG